MGDGATHREQRQADAEGAVGQAHGVSLAESAAGGGLCGAFFMNTGPLALALAAAAGTTGGPSAWW
jgi:hypothetical protein